jgi:hypothetical protein
MDDLCHSLSDGQTLFKIYHHIWPTKTLEAVESEDYIQSNIKLI